MLKEGEILAKDGTLLDEGYSFDEVKKYNKKLIPSHYASRVKEWDYYCFNNNKVGFLLTIANNTYMTYVSFSFLNFLTKSYVTKTYARFLPLHPFKLPVTPSKGNIEIADSKFYLKVTKDSESTKIIAKFTRFAKNMDLKLNLSIKESAKNSSIYILHPFENKYNFYYNFKKNLLFCEGKILLGRTLNLFSGYGCYDWGRGIWPYKTSWYWISTSLKDNDGLKGFNLGFGFGTLNDSENVLYFNDKHYKLGEFDLEVPKDEKNKINFLSEWKLTSKDKVINLTFTPILNRKDSINALILSTKQNQIFGNFNGTIKVDGKEISFSNSLGFIEKFDNRW